MVELYNARTDEKIGTIAESQFQFMVDQLEEESLADQDYYINRETLRMFQRRGADTELLALLADALGERQEMDIRWQRS